MKFSAFDMIVCGLVCGGMGIWLSDSASMKGIEDRDLKIKSLVRLIEDMEGAHHLERYGVRLNED